MTEYTKPALPEPDIRLDECYYSPGLVIDYSDACVAAYKAHIRAEHGEPVAWTDARLRGIASDYFSNSKDWPAAMLCMRHLLMEQAASAPQAPLKLTDEQLRVIIERECGPVQRISDMLWAVEVGRAVLAAAQEKK